MAFLRGMNLGRRRIKNDELCAAFEGMGFENVSAFLASGNVVFDAEDGNQDNVADAVETGLKDALGYDVPTFLRTADEVIAIAKYSPFGGFAGDGVGKVQVAMLGQPIDQETAQAVLGFASDDDLLEPAGKELHWLPSNGISGSELDLNAVERLVGPMTIRTKRTVERLAKRFLVNDA